jgi:hypothetical protein
MVLGTLLVGEARRFTLLSYWITATWLQVADSTPPERHNFRALLDGAAAGLYRDLVRCLVSAG